MFSKRVSNFNNILSWKPKGLSDESITHPSASNNILSPLLNYVGTKIMVEFKGSCLKQDKTLFNNGKLVNIYIVNEINKNFDINSYLTLEKFLFGSILILISTDILNMIPDLIFFTW